MIKGAIIFPKRIPNLNQILLTGINNLEFNKPSIKKIDEIINDQIRISPLFKIGHIAINKNTTKKTIPKLRLVGNFIFEFIVLNY